MAAACGKLILLVAGLAAAAPSALHPWGLDIGVLDVTAEPFSVDKSGRVDVSDRLQAAIKHAHDNFLAVYLPHGEYLVSRTLTFYSNNSWDYPGDENNTFPCRFQPNVLLGERAAWDSGDRPVRPVIRLADNAPGFSGPLPRPVLDFERKYSEVPYVDGINFNQLLRGVDVHIGAGTPQATGVEMPGAQGCSIQDVTVRVGSGYAGIVGGSGAGGSHTNVRVEGGRVGLDYTVSLNAPATNAATLVGQTEAAIVYVGFQAASFTGTYIAPASRSVPALRSVDNSTKYGQVSMIDSVLEYPLGTSECMAFQTLHSLYLRHVHVQHCAVVPDCTGTPLAAASGAWTTVHELARGVSIQGSQQCTQPRFQEGVAMPIYVDGVRSSSQGDSQPCYWLANMTEDSVGPGARLTEKHRWDEKSFPTFDTEASQAFNVKAYGAVGDGVHDDSGAIQKAVDSAVEAAVRSPCGEATVFIPKGFFRLTRTINMTAPSCTTLTIMGMARHLSVLMPMSDGLVGMERNPAPLLHIGSTDATVHLTMFTGVTWEHLKNVWALEWQNRNVASIYRQNYFYRITECFYGFPHPIPVPLLHPNMPCKPAALLEHPLNVVSGSGRFFNFENEDFLYEAPQYRHMLLTAPSEGPQEVHMYSMNFEHASSNANAEIVNASNVYVYSFKTEGEWRDIIYHNGTHNPGVGLQIKNSSNVNVFSHGGNARARPSGSSVSARSIYLLEDSCPVRLSNLVDQFQFGDDDWNMVEEVREGTSRFSNQCDRPVLFARTNCEKRPTGHTMIWT